MRNIRIIGSIILLLTMLISPSLAYAENVFIPEVMVTAYNASIEPVFEAMMDDGSSADGLSSLMEVEYLAEMDGSIYYANYDQSFYLYFDTDSRWGIAKSVMAYADITDDSLMKNLPMYPLVCAVASLDSSCDLMEILEWYNEATYGDVFVADSFNAVYTSKAYEHVAVALFPN